MGSETYHEPIESLTQETKDMHRAIVSLKEELDAVDWYQQRAEACTDDELRAVLFHNKNEEIEHAMMNLEWIRRHSKVFDTNIGTYLNKVGSIVAIEANESGTSGEKGAGSGAMSEGSGAMSAGSGAMSAPSPCLGIGSLRRSK